MKDNINTLNDFFEKTYKTQAQNTSIDGRTVTTQILGHTMKFLMDVRTTSDSGGCIIYGPEFLDDVKALNVNDIIIVSGGRMRFGATARQYHGRDEYGDVYKVYIFD